MADNIVSPDEFFAGTGAPSGAKKIVSADEFLGGPEPEPTVIPPLAEEHKASFIKDFSDIIAGGMADVAIRLGGATLGAFGALNNEIGALTGLNAFKKYRENFIEPGRRAAAMAKEAAPTENLLQSPIYGLIDSIGNLAPTLPFDVMTGGATRLALVGRVLPKMEAALAAIPNFALGAGWRGMVEGIQTSGESVPEKVLGGVTGAAESMAINTLFANAGTGLKGIGKMASLGLAQSFYNGAKEGRLPTADEMIENTSNAAMLGVAFTALPHLAEASQVAQEKNVLRAYVKKYLAEVEGVGPKMSAAEYLAKKIKESTPKGMLPEEVPIPEIPNLAPNFKDNNVFYRGMSKVEYDKGGTGQFKSVAPDEAFTYAKGNAARGGEGVLVQYVDGKISKAFSVNKEGVVAQIFGESEVVVNKAQILSEYEAASQKAPDLEKVTKIFTDLVQDARIRPEVRVSLAQSFLDKLDARGDIAPMEFKLGQWQDRGKFAMYRETMERNIERVAGGAAKEVQAETTEKIKENETYHQRWVTTLMNQVNVEMTQKGIKPNTEASKLAMRYGEGRMTEAQLQAARPKDWQNIKSASDFCRQVYGDTLTAVNSVRSRYGYEPIEARQDYFRHFQEINLAANLFGCFLGGEKVPTSIAGVINRSKYGKPFSATELERRGNEFKEDAVLALQNYAKSIGPQLFHLDSVQRIRTLEGYIRNQAAISEAAIADGQPVAKIDLSNFVEKLTQYGNLLAGQPSTLSAPIHQNFDRPFIAGVRALQKNATANMIAYNLSAMFMNALPIAQQVATTNPRMVVKGLVNSALHLNRDTPFEIQGTRSEFYDRRYPKNFLPKDVWEQVVQKGYVLPNLVDRLMVQALISGKYFEGIDQGLKPAEAMKAADNYASRTVQDRSTGQVPLMMAEPDLRLLTAFQVEINNLWSWMGHDIPKESQGKLGGIVGRMAVFAIASTMVNNVYEKMLGRRPQLDFLYMAATLFGATKSGRDRTLIDRVSVAGKDLLGNVPFGNLFVHGGRFPIAAAIPDWNAIAEDPEHKLISEMSKPLFYGLLPAGGGQLRKTLEGVASYAQGFVALPSGEPRFEIQQDFPNFVRAFLFGKNSFPEAVDYWSTPPNER